MTDYPQDENPYMQARSLEELIQMEKDLYTDTWKDGKIIPGMEDYYNHQIELFEEAYSVLFPEDYDFHRKSLKS
jgi:hypothetical protein